MAVRVGRKKMFCSLFVPEFNRRRAKRGIPVNPGRCSRKPSELRFMFILCYAYFFTRPLAGWLAGWLTLPTLPLHKGQAGFWRPVGLAFFLLSAHLVAWEMSQQWRTFKATFFRQRSPLIELFQNWWVVVDKWASEYLFSLCDLSCI